MSRRIRKSIYGDVRSKERSYTSTWKRKREIVENGQEGTTKKQDVRGPCTTPERDLADIA